MSAADEAEIIHTFVAIHDDLQDRLRRKAWLPRGPEDALAAYMGRLLQDVPAALRKVANDA